MSTKRKQVMRGRNPSRSERESTQTPVRVGGRIKKAKTIYDPSEHLFPRKRRMQQSNSKRSSIDEADMDKMSNGENSSDKSLQGWCLICLKNTPKLLTCKRCSYKAHFDCLDDTKPEDTAEDFENDWLCGQCKVCTVCQKGDEHTELTECWKCHHLYHRTCHRPRIPKAKKKKWICTRCLEAESEEEESGESTSRETTPKVKTLKSEEIEIKQENEKKKDDNYVLNPFGDQPVPDVTSWSAAEVFSYFSKHFPAEAEVFREQEIDGASLVLMKRDDVVSGLKLKLGPAIRIYRHVVMLQKRSTDPRLAWC